MGLRPIALYGSCYRNFARARRSKVKHCFNHWADLRPEVVMAPGRHTTHAIWRSMLWQFICTSTDHFFQWNLDLWEASDHVGRMKLRKEGERQGYPLNALATSLASNGRGPESRRRSSGKGGLRRHRQLLCTCWPSIWWASSIWCGITTPGRLTWLVSRAPFMGTA